MQVLVISPHNFGVNFELIARMHQLRFRVFKERLDWEVSVSGEMEVDRYDGLGPTYLLVLSSDRNVIGCVRFLPTTGPNMLANTFPTLLAGKAPPCSKKIFESSRFCVDTSRADQAGESGIRMATFHLFAAMVEWGLHYSPDGIVTVTDLRMERILRRAGWALTRIGAPQEIGSTTAVAGLLEISTDALMRLRTIGGLSEPVISFDPAIVLAA